MKGYQIHLIRKGYHELNEYDWTSRLWTPQRIHLVHLYLPEEDAEQLAQVHVVWSLLKAQAAAVVQVHGKLSWETLKAYMIRCDVEDSPVICKAAALICYLFPFQVLKCVHPVIPQFFFPELKTS